MPRPSPPPSLPRPAAGLLLALTLIACGSPNRGTWEGTFDGSVSGVVEFEINARGTKIKGKMTGQTAAGESFDATLEGTLRRDFLRAEFEGKAGAGFGLPIPFEGLMTGSLELGKGEGDWTCQLYQQSSTLAGTWSVDQI